MQRAFPRRKHMLPLLLGVLMLTPAQGALPAAAAAQPATTNLKTNDLVNPIGLGERPRFSWQMVSDVVGQKQTAYRIAVYDAGKEIWTTGKVADGGSVGIPYAGPALQSCTRYSWEVQVWDKDATVHKAEAAFETGLLGDTETAWAGSQWISLPGAGPNRSSTFRKAFTPEKAVKSARLYATGLGVFETWINGEPVGSDVLKPGFTMMTKRVNAFAYDVTGLLAEGENVVSSVVTSGWWTGKAAPGNPGKQNAIRAKLVLFYEDGTSETIGTGTDWKAADASPIRMAGIWEGETYDANFDLAWMRPGFDDAAWKAAVVNAEFGGEITPMVGSRIRVREDLELAAKSVTVYDGATGESLTQHGKINVTGIYGAGEPFTLRPGETAVVDLGQNFSGWSYFEAEGPKGAEITIRHGEMRNDSNGLKSRGNDGPEGSVYVANLRGSAATARYIMNGSGMEAYHSAHTFYGFRYFSITVTQPVTFRAVKGMVVTSVETDTARLTTSDESVNQLISNIFWGMYSNYLSIPTDCPQRDERQGWTADTQVFSATGAYSADVKGFFEKWMTDMRDSQREDGAFPDCAPTGYGGFAALGWGDAGVLVPYNMYKIYGDAKCIEDNWDAMVKFMDIYMAGTKKWGGGHSYGDWLAYESNDNTIKNCCGVAYYAMDALFMSGMARATGREADAARYMQVYETEKAFFQKKFVKHDGSLTRPEQTACLMALWADLLPDEASKQKVTQALLGNIARNGNKLQTGFLGTAVLLPVLTQIGAVDTAYELLLQRENPSWLYSVDQGATTIWERWNSFTRADGFGDVGMNSFNHYAYGAVAEWMYGYMAGILYDFDAPGFQHIILKPYPSPAIQTVNGAFDSPYGTIISNWAYADDKFAWDVTVPANATATICAPVGEGAPLTVNGLAPEALTLEADGIEFVGYEGDRAVFSAAAGSFRFDTTAPVPGHVDVDPSALLPPKQAGFPWVWASAGLGGVLLAAGAAGLVLYRRRKARG